VAEGYAISFVPCERARVNIIAWARQVSKRG